VAGCRRTGVMPPRPSMPSVDAIMQLTADVSRAGDTITTMRDAAGAMGAAFRAAAAPSIAAVFRTRYSTRHSLLELPTGFETKTELSKQTSPKFSSRGLVLIYGHQNGKPVVIDTISLQMNASCRRQPLSTVEMTGTMCL